MRERRRKLDKTSKTIIKIGKLDTRNLEREIEREGRKVKDKAGKRKREREIRE